MMLGVLPPRVTVLGVMAVKGSSERKECVCGSDRWMADVRQADHHRAEEGAPLQMASQSMPLIGWLNASQSR